METTTKVPATAIKKSVSLKTVKHFVISRLAVTRDFANAYRQSIKHRQSVTRRVSSSTGGTLRQVHPSVTQATSITGNTLRKSRRPSARQLVREGSAIGSLGRRVIDGLSPLSDFSVPPTPRTPKFSPHNIFELDDVSTILYFVNF